MAEGNQEVSLKRTMPNSLEVEQSVIASMLIDRKAILTASEILTKEDFYYSNNGIMFETMVELYQKGQETDVVIIQNRLREKNVPPELSELEYLIGLASSSATSVNVGYYANIVREKATLRKIIRVSEEIASSCYNQEDSLDILMEEAEKQMFDVLQHRGSSDTVSIKQIVLNTLNEIERAAESNGEVTGLPTGFTDLDYRLSGLQPSDLILVAARPSMGKTAFVLNIAEYIALHEHHAVAIFSLEMSKEQLVRRILSMRGMIDAQGMRNGNLPDGDWQKLIEAAQDVAESKLLIEDTPGITVSELSSKCRKFKLENDIKLIIIDYIGLMSGSGKKGESRQQEISDISRGLKQDARELKVPVIALSQLSRQVEQRESHRPILSDLRDSGAIEQDADVVMFLYRDEYYNKDSEKKGIAEVNVAKQRNGPIGSVELAWLGQYTKFANLERPKK